MRTYTDQVRVLTNWPRTEATDQQARRRARKITGNKYTHIFNVMLTRASDGSHRLVYVVQTVGED